MSERSIFMAAADKDNDAERQKYLDAACKDDPAMRERIDRLLNAHREAGGILDKPPADQAFTASYAPITERPGTQDLAADRRRRIRRRVHG